MLVMEANQMTAVSLFAGVGGFDLALERNGVKVVATVEIDKNASGVLAHRFPEAELFGDVSEVTGEQLRAAGFDPANGIITGGFPCQDLSVAGKRAGLEGARSGLFWEIMRLADELRPKWIILENVPGLLSSKGGRDMGIVVGALAERGYGFSYRVLDAQFFGVPQRRRRVFIVCCLGDDGRASAEVLALAEGMRGDSKPRNKKGQEVAGTLGGGSGSRGWAPDTDRMTFVPVRPFIKAARAQTADGYETWKEAEVTPTLNQFDNGGDQRATVLAIQEPTAYHHSQYGNFAEGAGPITARYAKDGSDALALQPIAFSHTQGLDPQASEVATPTLRMNGGGQAVMAYDEYNDRITENHQTLRSGTKQSTGVLEGTAVRRLTPMECERLQGFPDGWTSHRIDPKKGLIEQADSPRYKQMGNAVAVPVVEWILSRLVAVESRSS